MRCVTRKVRRPNLSVNSYFLLYDILVPFRIHFYEQWLILGYFQEKQIYRCSLNIVYYINKLYYR